MKLLILIGGLLLSFSAIGQKNSHQSYWKTVVEKDVKALGLDNLDSTSIYRTYRIWNSNYQVVELSQLGDSAFKGQIVNYVTKIIGTKKKPKSKLLIHKIKIPAYTVKNLIDILYASSIETLPDSYELKNYPQGFDGKNYVFEISKLRSYRLYSYWEPENERYQNGAMYEIISIRKILKTLNNEFPLSKYFSGFIDRLPKGQYRYGGITMVKS